MIGCIAEDDLIELARGGRALGENPLLESHLADCPACSSLLATLIAVPREDAERRDLTGRTLGPYRLDALIGAGAMGEVYRGRDLRLQRNVAVKVLSARFAESPDRVRRLEAEGRAAAAITHPNVVTVYDSGSDGGVPFIVSELIHGESLRSVIDRGRVPRATALALGRELARGLAAAHAQGVVHRDLKPGNLIVTDDGTLKILDFGLAKLSGDRELEATEPGTLLGTSGYLSPEQARADPADARSDIFALGAILYELLSGQRAFGGATFADRLSAVLRDTPPPLDDAADPVIRRCLDKDPARRFQSANDLAWTLEGLLRPGVTDAAPPAPAHKLVARRTFLVGAAAAGLGGAALGRWLAPRRAAFLPEVRQLTFRHGRVASARFTSDGGSLLHSAAWDDHPLATYTARLGGGGQRPLDLPSGKLLAVSSRGDIALSIDHRFIEGFHERGQLVIAPLEGGEPRGLGMAVQHADFTPDGAELAIIRAASGLFRLELPAGRILFEGGWLSHPRVSPDGTQVACLVHDVPWDDRGGVALIPRSGGAARMISPDWSSIDGLAWTPGGRALWITASREGGNNAVRSIGLDGRPLSQVPSAGRLRIHDVARDGRLAVTQCSGRMRMMVKAPGASQEVDLALSDVSLVADISADGSQVTFAEFGDVDTANGAYLRPTRGGTALHLGAGIPVDLAEDGRGVLAIRYGGQRLVIFPTSSGQPRVLGVGGLAEVLWARWCAGGGILVVGAAAGRPRRRWRLDPDRTLVPLTDETVAGRAQVSPDGTRAALIHDDRLLVVTIDRVGPPTVVAGSYVDEDVCSWLARGTAVALRSKSPPIQIRRLDLASGASAQLLEIDPPLLGRRGVDEVVVSENGEAYAYSYGQELSRLYTMTAEEPGA